MKLHRIRIAKRPESEGALVGGNTEIFLDDKPLAGVSKLHFRVRPDGAAKVYLELYPGSIEFDELVEVKAVEATEGDTPEGA